MRHPGCVTASALLLTWPKTRPLSDADTGEEWAATIEPGRLDLDGPDGCLLTVTDPDALRAFAMQVYAAAVELDQSAALSRARGRAAASSRPRARLSVPSEPTAAAQGRLL